MTTELLELKKKAIDGMVSYMTYEDDPEFDAGYTRRHIDQCSKIIDEYLDALANVRGSDRNESILKVVKAAILKLNKLNDKCDGCLIETGQREDLCELIESAAKHAGLVSSEDDITEEWREW